MKAVLSKIHVNEQSSKTYARADREEGSGKLATAAAPFDEGGGEEASDDAASRLIGVRAVRRSDGSVASLSALR